jgi:hypothetical protein
MMRSYWRYNGNPVAAVVNGCYRVAIVSPIESRGVLYHDLLVHLKFLLHLLQLGLQLKVFFL